MKIDLSSLIAPTQPASPVASVEPTVVAPPVITTVKDPAFFNVSLQPVSHTVNGKSYDGAGYRAVVNEDDGTIIGMHKSRYSLVTNEEVITQFEEALRHSDLDTRGMKVETRFSHNKARMFRQYILPKHAVNPAVGDTVEMRLILNNSYDGSLCFDYTFGGYRLACKNGMVVPNGDSLGERRKHTSGLDIKSIAGRLNTSADKYRIAAQEWQAWITRPVSDVDAQAVIAKIPNLTPDTREKVYDYFVTESVSMGKTVWALYNAITYWSTHQDVRQANQANVASIVREREQRIARVMQTKEFLAVA